MERQVEDRLSFSLSEGEEGVEEDTTDSLDIKPPQATAIPLSSHRGGGRSSSTNSKYRKEKESRNSRGEKTSGRTGSELSINENSRSKHSHRSDSSSSSSKRRDLHKSNVKSVADRMHRITGLGSSISTPTSEREVYYRGSKGEGNGSQRMIKVKEGGKRSSHHRSEKRERRDRRRDDKAGSRDHRSRKDNYKNERDREKARLERQIRQQEEDGEKLGEMLIQDLRGRLLEKRSHSFGGSSYSDRKKMRKDREREKLREKEGSLLRQIEVIEDEEEEMEEGQKSPSPSTDQQREEEREERKAKLLEAEREMALRKEVSRRELEARRERQTIEKEKQRMLKEIARKNAIDTVEEGQLIDDDDEPMDTDHSEDKSTDNDTDDESDDEDDTSSSTATSSEEDEEERGEGDQLPPLEKSPRTPEVPPAAVEDEEEAEEDDEWAKLPPYFPAIQGCRSVEEFQCLNRIEEGTYGVVYRARDKRTSDIVALKRLKMEKEKEGFPITSLREINTLLKAQHPNIVTVREIVVGSNMDKIFIVMDYVEHDLKSLMETMKQKKQVFVPGEIKCIMIQLLRAVAHLHDNWILHRDLKTSNLLLSHKGVLKVGDFGLAREYGSPLKGYTPIVVTLWYRAPELLLQAKEYSTPIDVWSVGCIFGELLRMEPLFNGRSEIEQLNKIFKELGTPNEKIWSGYSKLPAVQKMTFTEHPVNQLRSRFGTMLSDLGVNLINCFLTYDPVKRITAEDALKHEYFKEAPLPIDPAMFPTWPAKSEQGVKKVNNSPKPPSGGKQYKQLNDTDEEVPSGGFHMGGEQRRINALGAGFSLRF